MFSPLLYEFQEVVDGGWVQLDRAVPNIQLLHVLSARVEGNIRLEVFGYGHHNESTSSFTEFFPPSTVS